MNLWDGLNEKVPFEYRGVMVTELKEPAAKTTVASELTPSDLSNYVLAATFAKDPANTSALGSPSAAIQSPTAQLH